jgi:hypothetical protein
MEGWLGIECPRISLSSLDDANSEEFQKLFYLLLLSSSQKQGEPLGTALYSMQFPSRNARLADYFPRNSGFSQAGVIPGDWDERREDRPNDEKTDPPRHLSYADVTYCNWKNVSAKTRGK